MTQSRALFSSRLFSLALAALTFAVYWAGMHGDFAFDDFGNIVGNSRLRTGSESQGWLDAASSGVAGPFGRGLSMLSFALNYRLFGEAAFSFKLTNLLIHFANALLVWILTRKVCVLLYPANDTRRSQMVAMLVCAVWALHPMNALPVLYVVQRMTSLSAFFMLAGLCLYVFARTNECIKAYLAIAVSLAICWPAAVFSKETGVLFGVYIVLLEWLVLRSFSTVPVRTVWLIGSIGISALAALSWANWNIVTSGYRVRDFDLVERLLTEPRILWFYVQQIVVPIPQRFGLYIDDIAVSRSFFDPLTTLLAFLAWIACAGIAWTYRKRWPAFTFAVFWFLGSHLLESTVLPLELVFEHRNYLASWGIWLWLMSIAVLQGSRARSSHLLQTLVLLFICYCAFISHLRAKQWSDDLTRREVEVYNHPLSARAHYEMAIGLQERTFESGRGNAGIYQQIRGHLQAAATLDPSGKVATLGLLYLDCLAGLPQNPAHLSELKERLATRKYSYMDRNAVQGLSTMLAHNKLCLSQDSVQSLLAAGLSNPTLDNALRGTYYTVGMDYAATILHDYPLALQFAEKAAAAAPNELALGVNLAHLYLQLGDLNAAKREYSRVSNLPSAVKQASTLAGLKERIESASSTKPVTH